MSSQPSFKSFRKKYYQEVAPDDLKFQKVVDVIPDKQTFLQTSNTGEFVIDIIVLTKQDFSRELFNYRRWLKKSIEPANRVAHFETLNEHGCFSLEKHDRVFNSRLRPGEEDERV